MNQLSLAIIVICSFLSTSIQTAAASETKSHHGHRHVKLPKSQQYSKASWYGAEFHGRKTASGQAFDMYAMSAAHKTLPLLSYAKVTNPKNHRSIIVRINDRGPFHGKRDMDLSYAAARKLGIRGVESVTITPLGRNQALLQSGKNNKTG